MQNFYSSGKLLLSGEYLVLDGALSLALPTRLGQETMVRPIETKNKLQWISKNYKDEIWFRTELTLPDLEVISYQGEKKVALTLVKILGHARLMNSDFLSGSQGFQIINKLGFPRDWGLGSSSTLINNIASWAEVDAFELLFRSFGGSGYDIACAGSESSILYQLDQNKPKVQPVDFNPPFKNNLYFVHLNKKQISSDSIKLYKSKKVTQKNIDDISSISQSLLNTAELDDFKNLMQKHENIISEVLEILPIQKRLFEDYSGQIKSLGGWGGDFILAAGNDLSPDYFKSKGFQTVISFENMIKS
ncbi:GHMP kinase [Lutimonas saemankumensis]|uniref:GYDIA family GHMP kinase n=1 Tax=Lutimonas saemankumensis TaxID=483016 RepID=UPI001CD3651E|nr:GYDIA family GHMP kinase [Lutimonas saemankumensis]MCA0932740.1 GHMP kinase [Lutimonas saemankumensis]